VVEKYELALKDYFIQWTITDCWRSDLHIVKPFKIPDGWIRFRAMVGQLSFRMRCCDLQLTMTATSGVTVSFTEEADMQT
jgi:hypothetical protein